MTSPITAALTERLIYDKEQQPQGIVDSEATPPLSVHDSEGAWENRMNRLLHVFTHVAGTWSSDAAWDEQDDGLVFNPQSPPTGPVSFRAGDGSGRISHDLVINSDGKISHTLWLFCILGALFQVAARSHFGASFGDLMERVERGPEAVASLTEFKARLINVQRYIDRLRHIHDRDSADGDMEGGGNHGSTSFPPFPHLAPGSLRLDYDTESDEFAQPPRAATVQVQPRPAITPGGTSTSNMTTDQDPLEPKVDLSRPLGAGPRDPEISTRFSSIPSKLFPRTTLISSHPVTQATGESYQETSSSSMGAYVDHTTGYSAQRDRSRSAERERPPKRVRRCSDSIVANRIDRLGRATPEFARQGQNREVLDASDEDDIQMVTDDSDATHQVALSLARIVVGLCHDRYRPPTLSKEQRGIGMTAAELGDLLDVSVSFVRIFGSSFLSYSGIWTLVALTLIV